MVRVNSIVTGDVERVPKFTYALPVILVHFYFMYISCRSYGFGEIIK
jgi:hypothetical protein